MVERLVERALWLVVLIQRRVGQRTLIFLADGVLDGLVPQLVDEGHRLGGHFPRGIRVREVDERELGLAVARLIRLFGVGPGQPLGVAVAASVHLGKAAYVAHAHHFNSEIAQKVN